MEKQQIISELKRLLSMPEVVSGFKSQQDCLTWAHQVAALLKPCKEHYAFFMNSLTILSRDDLHEVTYRPTFNTMVSIAKQGLYELEYNISPDIYTAPTPDKRDRISSIRFIASPNWLFLEYIEKKWREKYGLPKLCSHSSGR